MLHSFGLWKLAISRSFECHLAFALVDVNIEYKKERNVDGIEMH